MVVKMMKWRPWQSKKLEARIRVHHLKSGVVSDDSSRYSVEIKWKGTKGISLSSLRKSVRRNFTKEIFSNKEGIVSWDEEFRCFCAFSANKDGLFHPWEVSFTLFNGTNSMGTASLNIADFDKQGRDIEVPLVLNDTTASLHLSILLVELKNVEEAAEPVAPRPILLFPRSPCYGEMFSTEKQDTSSSSSLKASPIRVNIFKSLSALRSKRAAGQEDESSDGRSSDNYPLDSDSDEGLYEEDSGVRKSFSYGTLASANHAGASISNTTTSSSSSSSSEDEDWLYYNNQTKASPVLDHPMQENSKRRLLPWRKRKLSFKSPNKMKGEPLLKKYYGEEGGDDIDFDRRQLSSSSDESTLTKDGENSGVRSSAFGDDHFAVGAWEEREITSRDGHMKLKTQVFFASIDQRNERAAGESACTALVAVIADWLQSNNNEMPIKSQLDSLIREGSLEWRNLCDNDNYRERFPDKHFDLETVLEAKVRPLSVVPEKSFIGFFHPQGLDDRGFDFLQGAMSFDNIWDEISAERPPLTRPLVYIISWNDHFFILKVEQDAYYIIDTLGERLYEGCNQAFILKFDRDSTIHQIANETQKLGNKPAEQNENKSAEGSTGKEVVTSNDAEEKNVEESNVVCTGKESCKEYIKSFLAAIPIRELLVDLKKGLLASTPLHHRLQIEFHYTKCLQPQMELPEAEAVDDIKGTLPFEALEAENL